jgi:hypothetical protein
VRHGEAAEHPHQTGLFGFLFLVDRPARGHDRGEDGHALLAFADLAAEGLPAPVAREPGCVRPLSLMRRQLFGEYR